MKKYTSNLNKRTNRKIKTIEAKKLNKLEKSKLICSILVDAFNELKEFTIHYNFESEEEEIEFFKIIKPKLFSQLIYHQKVYNIQMLLPHGGRDSVIEYLRKELDSIQDFTEKRIDFYRYFRSGSTYLDRNYFLRHSQQMEHQYFNIFSFERDPRFSTVADFKVARILANNELEKYLKWEIELLCYMDMNTVLSTFPREKITWQYSKTDLYELIYALDSIKAFGKVTLVQLINYFESVFNVALDKNASRTFGDMKIRNTPTPFIDKLKNRLLKRMKRE